VQRSTSDRQAPGVRWARWATRRRKPILWSALFVAIASAPIAARLPLHGDMSYLLPPDTVSVRDLHALEARAQVFGTIIVAIESDDAGRRAEAARLVRERLTALPAGTLLGIAADSAARDRFAWEHRHVLVPTADLTAVRDELARRKARLNPLFVSLDDDEAGARAEAGPAFGERLRDLKRQLDAAKAGAEHPTPLVSTDGRLQIIFAPGSPVQYIQHTKGGSLLATPGLGRWTFQWTAPSTAGFGPITFNVAANASNDDQSPLGDYVYTFERTIRPAAEPAHRIALGPTAPGE